MRPLRNFKPDQCCHLISRIANRAFFLNGEKGRERFRACYLHRMWNASEFMKTLKQLADGPKRPNELRAAVGIASANYFTARYLTPLAEAGYIAVEGGEKNRYAPDKRYKLLHKGKAVTDA